MKAILLAGGLGTRLRPLTVNTPKPVVPIFDRPFLAHQIQLLRRVPEVDEVVLSLNYRPERIQAVIGTGADLGLTVRYAVEPEPLGTGGAIRYAAQGIEDTLIVFNGDVLTDTDLGAVLARHRQQRARATIVLTPVANPAAYGLVETDADGRVRRFVEKPDPAEITCDTINAGIYILEPDTLDRIPAQTPWSIERQYFPSLVEDGEPFVAHVDRGYWLDIGTPDKYRLAHRDIMTGRCAAYPFLDRPSDRALVADDAVVADDATLVAPCFVASGARVASRARVGPYTVLGPGSVVGPGSTVEDTIVWAETCIGSDTTVRGAVLGRGVRVEDRSTVGPGAVVGDRSVITAHSRLELVG